MARAPGQRDRRRIGQLADDGHQLVTEPQGQFVDGQRRLRRQRLLTGPAKRRTPPGLLPGGVLRTRAPRLAGYLDRACGPGRGGAAGPPGSAAPGDGPQVPARRFAPANQADSPKRSLFTRARWTRIASVARSVSRARSAATSSAWSAW